MNPEELLDHNPTLNSSKYSRRRDMLPMWIKVFTWIFIILGAFSPFALVAGLLQIPFALSLYGLETNTPFSILGFLLILLLCLKGITAYGLWTEKDWAIKIAKVDAAIGIAFSIINMFGITSYLTNNMEHIRFSFRLELLVFIPYWRFLTKIQSEWEDFS